MFFKSGFTIFRRLLDSMIFALMFLIPVSLVWAGTSESEPAIEDLRTHARPKPSDMLRVFNGKLPRKNPFPIDVDTKKMIRSPEALKEVSTFIIDLERKFPGATLAFLGRDSASIYDAVSAFYTAIGQPDRVVRLDASTASINSVNENDLVAFLKANGLQLDNLDKAHGYVMIDTTSFSSNSQSYKLLNSVYNTLAKKDEMSVDLTAMKINFVSLNRGSVAALSKSNGGFTSQIVNYFQYQNRRILQGAMSSNYILSYPMSNFTYTAEWHDTFGAIRPDANGVPVARLGTVADLATREKILGFMFETVKTFGSDTFVKNLVQQSGYTFPLKRPQPISRRLLTLKKIFDAYQPDFLFQDVIASEEFQNRIQKNMDRFNREAGIEPGELSSDLRWKVKDFFEVVLVSQIWYGLSKNIQHKAVVDHAQEYVVENLKEVMMDMDFEFGSKIQDATAIKRLNKFAGLKQAPETISEPVVATAKPQSKLKPRHFGYAVAMISALSVDIAPYIGDPYVNGSFLLSMLTAGGLSAMELVKLKVKGIRVQQTASLDSREELLSAMYDRKKAEREKYRTNVIPQCIHFYAPQTAH